MALGDIALAMRASSSASGGLLEDVFTRVNVARLASEDVSAFVKILTRAIEYWRKRGVGANGAAWRQWRALAVLTECLARLSLRVSAEEAKELFGFAAEMGQRKEILPWEVYAPLNALLAYTLESIPRSQQRELLSAALAFPLPDGATNCTPDPWPNPVIEDPGDRNAHGAIDRPIDRLIGSVEEGMPVERISALARLLPLVRAEGFLTDAERQKLAKALWGETPGYQNLPWSDVLPHVFLILPATDRNSALRLARKTLLDHASDALACIKWPLRQYPSPEVQGAINAYRGLWAGVGEMPRELRPTSRQAVVLFRVVINWRPCLEGDDLGMGRKQLGVLADEMGRALSEAIVPAMSAKQRGRDQLEQLTAFFNEVPQAFSVLPAFVYFAAIDPAVAERVADTIQKALRGKTPKEVAYATWAVRKWTERSPVSGDEDTARKSTMVRLFSILDSGWATGWEYLLECAYECGKMGALSKAQWRSLREVVREAYAATDYAGADLDGEKLVSLPAVRSRAVRIAKALCRDKHLNDRALEDIVTAALDDPLPEVRFAAHDI